MKNSKWLTKSTFALTDQALFSGAGFLLSLFLGRWLSPAQYGSYALAYAIFLFSSAFHNSILLEPMGVLGPALFREFLPTYIAKLVRIHTYVAFPLSALMLICATSVYLFSKNTTLAWALAGASFAIPFVLFSWLLRQSAYLDRRPHLAARGGATYTAVVAISLFVAHQYGLLNPFTAFVMQSLAGFISGYVMLALLKPDFERQCSPVGLPIVLNEHWAYGRWVIITSFVYWLSGQAYYFIAASMLGLVEVATLRALLNFLLPLSQFVTSLSLLVIPSASEKVGKRSQKDFERLIRTASALFVGAGIAYFFAVYFLGGPLMTFVYGEKYAHAKALLPILAISGALVAAAQGPVIGLRALKAPSEVFVAYSVSGCFTVLTGAAFIRYWGLKGAAIGMALSSLSFLIAIVIKFKRCAKLHWHPAALPSSQTQQTTPTRVSWLLPSMTRAPYWQPVLKEFATHYPISKVFTSRWDGFVHGYSELLDVTVLPGLKLIKMQESVDGYDRIVARAPISIIRELVRFKPDVVFVSAFNVWTLYALCLKIFLRFKILVIFDGISPSVTYEDRLMRLWSRRVMAFGTDGAISNMKSGVEYLGEVIGIPPNTLVHHPYEVPDISLLCSGGSASLSLQTTRPIFLFVGSLTERKGWRRILEAAEILLKRGCLTFSVLLVGPSDRLLEVREEIKSRGLSRHIEARGPVAYENLGEYFNACDVFVFPTQEDVWGVVLLEALASGKAVICSRNAGSRELVIDGFNGFIFDPKDAEKLAQCMERFIVTPELADKLGKQAAQSMSPYSTSKAGEVLAEMVTTVSRKRRKN